MIDKVKSIRPVLLCGGSGTRLWPMSRESFPKQFVRLVEGKSLFELTIDRIQKFGSPICVANEEHKFLVNAVLADRYQSKADSGFILLEPVGRNTAAAMTCVALMPQISASDLLLFLPSDHYLPNIEAFTEMVHSGISAAYSGYIVTFGIQPNFPSTAYGYIRQGKKLEEINNNFSSSDREVGNDFKFGYEVDSFVEKPHFDKAQEMVLTGEYLWNAGIFLCQASVLLDALSRHSPDILESCKDAMNNATIDESFLRPERNSFLACRSESIDYAVMEKFEKIAVIPFMGVWSDIGNWSAVAKLSDSDESGNRIDGGGLAIQATNTYISASSRPVVALGTTNLIIVDTVDAVLVVSADKVEQVKEVVLQLKKNGTSQAVMHRCVPRPWGWYDLIDAGDRFKVKRITVKPGAGLSLQMHRHRAEHWVVVKGTAKVTNGERVFILEEDESTYIPVGVRHRLENPGETDLEMIEVQSGDYLGEDDIVRFDDAYGRS